MAARLSKAELLVHVFSILLGLNSLISTNGLWVELPLMIPRLPESWSLPSYLTFIIQAANIGPIVYAILNHLFPSKVTERPTCYLMLFVGSSAALLMASFWDTTVSVFGAVRSLPLFILTFCLGMVDSLSSLVCFPYMALLKPQYMTSYMIGEGLSGFLPTVLAIIQGSSEVDTRACENATSNHTASLIPEQPVFTVEAFFYGIFTMLLTSWIGFYLLNNLSVCKSEMVNGSEGQERGKDEERSSRLFKYRYGFLLFLQFYIPALFYGVLPSIQSYSCLPYGVLPFYLSVVLYSIASPTMAVVYALRPIKSVVVILALVVVGSGITVYLMLTAVMSPSPPLEEYLVGKIILIACWTGVAAAFGYSKVVVASLLCEMSHQALFWGGVLIQVGATLGAAFMFTLVVGFQMFIEETPCS